MHMIEHLRELFRYNDWANRRMVAAIRDADNESSRQILAHLLVTENEYYERLYGKDSTGFDFWPEMSIAECSDLARANATRFEQLLAGFNDEGLNIKAKYRTSEGSPYENTYCELLTHVLLHSSIHRGNIMIKLRESGIAPPAIDYIVWLRETN